MYKSHMVIIKKRQLCGTTWDMQYQMGWDPQRDLYFEKYIFVFELSYKQFNLDT